MDAVGVVTAAPMPMRSVWAALRVMLATMSRPNFSLECHRRSKLSASALLMMAIRRDSG